MTKRVIVTALHELMVLRDATLDDAPALLRLMHDAFEEYRGVLDPPSAAHNETIDTMRERLRAGAAVLAETDQAPIGLAFYQPQDTHMYFSRLSVLPAYRNRGVGRALIEYVEGRARDAGLAGVRLGVRVQLPHLRARYERLGYAVTRHMTHSGHAKPTYVLMEKTVT